MLKVRVEVYQSIASYEIGEKPFRFYIMNHDVPIERKVLGAQCRNAFEAGQVIVTYPVK